MAQFISKYKMIIFLLLFLLVSTVSTLKCFDYIQTKKELFELNTYKKNVLSMKNSLLSMIQQKKSSTIALALSIASHHDLIKMVKNENFTEDRYEKLINNLRINTDYKNIWIQVINKKGISIYRSWTEKKGDNIASFRDDVKMALEVQKVSSTLSVGKFNLSLKAMVPIYDGAKFIGIIEIISHFNSISKRLVRHNIHSVVIVNRQNSKKILYPFTNIYIDDYYIANFDAKPKLRKYIQKKGVESFLHERYKIADGYLIVSYTLKDEKKRAIGSYVMFKSISAISTVDLDFFLFKFLSIFVFIWMLIILSVAIWLYSSSQKQKQYYKNIIDSSTNIIIINNVESILSVNKVFFDYFYGYKSLQSFREKHQCICELFQEGEAYLQKSMDDESWIKHLVKHKGEQFKIKIVYFDKIYYFSIAASLISKEKNHYALTLSDITEQENYKQKLEKLTITDPLTQVGNRRYFQSRMDEEMAKSHRHKHDLSLIIFDIDNFKNVNDVYGHSVGDEVLVEYTNLVSSKLRSGDALCRIGGEEFIVIVPHTNIDNAFILAEKLRNDIELHKKIIPITMSFGVTKYIYGESVEDIFKRVDKALYKAKESGRNRVIIG